MISDLFPSSAAGGLATLEEIFHDQPDIVARIRHNDTTFIRDFLDRITRPLPTGEPWDWVIAAAHLKTPTINGPFDPAGRHYMREPINNANNPDLREETDCMGTGTGKTLVAVLRWLWAMEHSPFSGLWINPAKEGSGGARQFNNGILIPTIEHTPCFLPKLPTGADRHDFAGLKLRFAGNDIDLVGGNSPTQLAAKRCHRVHLDEQDKLKEKLGREGSADQLAGERTKQVPNAQITRGSTPTLENYGIWPHLMRSDLRRRFLPCPHCNTSVQSPNAALRGWFVLVKDPQFTVLPTKFEPDSDMPAGTEIPMASLRWDKEAKRKDGTWDIDHVIRTARFECPHCGGHIRDHHRIWMDQHGQWLRTRNAIGHAGYHLPSFYAPQVDFSSTFGGMAKKFLDNLEAGTIQGVINSDYAEVHVSQEQGRHRLELTARPIAQADWTPLMTVDIQKHWPYLWFVIRKWSSFKLLDPFTITNGKITNYEKIPEPIRKKCDLLIAGEPAAIPAVADLLRFDTGTEETPLLDFCLARQITGQALAQLHRERCLSNILEFGKFIYREIGLKMPRGGDSEAIAVGHCETNDWTELRELFVQFEIGKHLLNRNAAVLIDSGYREKNNPETLRKCYETATQFGYYDPASKKLFSHPPHKLAKPCPLDNWQPWKGYPITKRWNIDGIARPWHYNYADPFDGTSEADTTVIQVLEGAADLFWEQMDALRNRRTPNVHAVSGELRLFPKNKFTLGQYERHLNARYWDPEKNTVANRGTGGAGHKLWPDELNDCEKMQIALADSLGFFSYENETKKP